MKTKKMIITIVPSLLALISDQMLSQVISSVFLMLKVPAFGAGFVEEMVFRGIIMNAIEKRFNKKAAIFVPSLLFGFVHILGRNFELVSCMLVVFAGTMVGIMFSLIAFEEKSIWNSAIVHTIWNLVILGNILSIGTTFNENSLYSYIFETKPFVLMGGEFGIESSIIAVAGYCLMSVFVLVSNRKRRA